MWTFNFHKSEFCALSNERTLSEVRADDSLICVREIAVRRFIRIAYREMSVVQQTAHKNKTTTKNEQIFLFRVECDFQFMAKVNGTNEWPNYREIVCLFFYDIFDDFFYFGSAGHARDELHFRGGFDVHIFDSTLATVRNTNFKLKRVRIRSERGSLMPKLEFCL